MLQDLAAEGFVATPLVDHKGRPVGVIGMIDRKPLGETRIIESTLQIFAARAAAEIERKRAEEDLAAEKERLAVTLRSIGDGFITIDNEGCVLMLNSIAERLTGWSQMEASGQATRGRVQYSQRRQPPPVRARASADRLDGACGRHQRPHHPRRARWDGTDDREQLPRRSGSARIARSAR